MYDVTVDIETVPTHDEDVKNEIRERLERENDSKQERYHKTFDEVWRKTSLDVVVAEPISIGLKIADEPTQVFMRTELTPESEIILLDTVFDYLRRELTSHTLIKNQEVVAPSKWIGFNLRDFDLRVLLNRCRVHGYDPRVRFHLDNSAQICDIMRELGGYSNKGLIPMSRVSAAFHVPGKSDDMHGSLVFDTFLAREFKKIAKYNASDVNTARNIYKKMYDLKPRPMALEFGSSNISTFTDSDFEDFDPDALKL